MGRADVLESSYLKRELAERLVDAEGERDELGSHMNDLQRHLRSAESDLEKITDERDELKAVATDDAVMRVAGLIVDLLNSHIVQRSGWYGLDDAEDEFRMEQAASVLDIVASRFGIDREAAS